MKNLLPWAQYYKNFFVRNLQIFVIGYSICPLEAFPT
jgi:hypothetical protein